MEDILRLENRNEKAPAVMVGAFFVAALQVYG